MLSALTGTMGIPAEFIPGIICGGIVSVRNVRRVRARLKIDRQSSLLTPNATLGFAGKPATRAKGSAFKTNRRTVPSALGTPPSILSFDPVAKIVDARFGRVFSIPE